MIDAWLNRGNRLFMGRYHLLPNMLGIGKDRSWYAFNTLNFRKLWKSPGVNLLKLFYRFYEKVALSLLIYEGISSLLSSLCLQRLSVIVMQLIESSKEILNDLSFFIVQHVYITWHHGWDVYSLVFRGSYNLSNN